MDMQSDKQKTDIMTIIQSDRKIYSHKDGNTIRHANKQT